jgi:hypothetical protein
MMCNFLEGEKLRAAKQLEEKIRLTREATKKVFHQHEFAPAYWQFNFEFFKRNINQVAEKLV